MNSSVNTYSKTLNQIMMKTLKITLGMIAMLTFLGVNVVMGQWSYNGTHIYNTNSGYVGIGNNSPLSLLYVGKNMTEPTITVRNLGGAGGASFRMWDNVSGADWKFKATNVGGFKIRDNANAIDVITVEPNSAANALYITTGGNVGLGTSAPTMPLQLNGKFNLQAENDYSFMYLDLDGIYSSGNCGLIYKFDGNYKAWVYWRNSDNLLNLTTDPSGSRYDLTISNTGLIGVHTATPQALVDVSYDANSLSRLGYNTTTANLFTHLQDMANQDNQSTIDAYQYRSSQNAGAGYTSGGTNQAVKGTTEYGDPYSFGVTGFYYNDFTRCGGVLGSNIYTASAWGSLSYTNSGNTNYGGYFTSSSSGSGKSNQGASIGIGIGSWGDLLGADIHGKVYGIYAEGGNYAMFSHGAVYKDNLDVNLQDNGTGTRTVLYTNVSTDVTVQTYGSATLSNGMASISFDPAFAASVSSEEPVVVTVTPTGSSNGVFLSQVSSSGFTVMENNAGKSSVTVNYIAIGKRAGYENPSLPKELIDARYTGNMTRGLHNDADTQTNGEGLYYENGQLVVGIHPSTLPDPNRAVTVKPAPVPNSSPKSNSNDSCNPVMK
jgi:hypothetical protein